MLDFAGESGFDIRFCRRSAEPSGETTVGKVFTGDSEDALEYKRWKT